MENVCDVNHLDVDVLLPPRKRLLVGLKKQSSDGDAATSPSRVVASCATVSKVVSSSPSSYSVEFEAMLKNLLSSHPTNPNLTPEEVVEASKAEAVAAVKAAKAARAAAEVKAKIAAKAVAAAKRALDLIASSPRRQWVARKEIRRRTSSRSISQFISCTKSTNKLKIVGRMKNWPGSCIGPEVASGYKQFSKNLKEFSKFRLKRQEIQKTQELFEL